jgi:hypothetical protein
MKRMYCNVITKPVKMRYPWSQKILKKGMIPLSINPLIDYPILDRVLALQTAYSKC